jgi:cyclase
MLQTRVIPCLLLRDEALVKTVKFSKPGYIGDPVNTVRIFNELEVDELVFLDIFSSKDKQPINFKILREIADECFMPLAYGGGLRSLDDAKTIFKIGFEKLVINSYAYEDPSFITQVANYSGNQSVIGAIDVKKNFFGSYEIYSHSGTKKIKKNVVEWARELERLGAGELFINSIDNDGTWKGLDVQLIQQVSSAVDIPVIACGGASSVQDIGKAVKQGGASAVAVGSMVVYQGKDLGVLVNFPDKTELEKELGTQ